MRLLQIVEHRVRPPVECVQPTNVDVMLHDQVADTNEGMVPILAGLKAGEKVAAEVTPEMRDGAKVQ